MNQATATSFHVLCNLLFPNHPIILRFLVEAADRLDDLGIVCRVTLKQMWATSFSLQTLSRKGSCEHGNEHSGSVKCGDEPLSDYWLLKKDFASWS
jgi:hypothetical protein